MIRKRTKHGRGVKKTQCVRQSLFERGLPIDGQSGRDGSHCHANSPCLSSAHMVYLDKQVERGAFMALISCPECGKQISDSTPACPHCGYQLSVSSIPSAPAPTKISEISQNYTVGIVMTVLGIFLLLVCLFALIAFPLLGIFIIWVPMVALVSGTQKISGTRSICCPHCGKIADVGKNFETYKCPACKKRSIRQDDYLKPVL